MSSPLDTDVRRDVRTAGRAFVALAALFFSVGTTAVLANLPDTAGAESASAATPAPAPVASGGHVTVQIEMGEFFYEPGRVEVPAGRPIRFEVTNPGRVPHELVIGNMAAQDAAERAMAEAGGGHDDDGHDDDGHGSDGAPTLYLEAGESGVLEATFAKAGSVLLGCHVPGHWAAGMRGTLVVT